MAWLTLQTRFGTLRLTEEAGRITRLAWGSGPDAPSGLLAEAAAQIRAYEAGTLTAFDLPLDIRGGDLVRAVCAEMRAIPHGETTTYGAIARAVGASAQAVGQACGANPIPILIPCHRVLGAGGKLTGFSGGAGIETKVALLRHEGAAGLLI